MTIVHICDYLPNIHSVWGGAEQAALRVIQLLNQKGAQQEIFISSYKCISQEKGLNGIPLRRLKSYEDSPSLMRGLERLDLMYLKRLWLSFDLASLFHSLFMFLRLRIGLIIIHSCHVLSLAPILAASLLRIPVVFMVYDYWFLCPETMLVDDKDQRCKRFHGPYCLYCRRVAKDKKRFLYLLRKAWFDFFLKRVERFVVLSQASQKMLQDYGIQPKKTSVIRVTLPEEFYLPLREAGHFTRGKLLFVGWVQPRKGLQVVIEALKKVVVNYPTVTLDVIGELCDKEYEEHIRKKVREYHLEEKVFIHGKKPAPLVAQFLKNSHAVIVAEQWENVSPLIVLEAMALAKVVVASRVGGIPEFIEDGVSGFLVGPNHPGDFAEKIMTVLGNDALRSRIEETARRKIMELCDRKLITTRWEGLIEQLKNKTQDRKF